MRANGSKVCDRGRAQEAQGEHQCLELGGGFGRAAPLDEQQRVGEQRLPAPRGGSR